MLSVFRVAQKAIHQERRVNESPDPAAATSRGQEQDVPPKMYKRTRQKPPRRPTATSQEQQERLISAVCSLCVTAVSCMALSGLWGRAVHLDRSLIAQDKNVQAQLNFHPP